MTNLQEKQEELKVFIIVKESTCGDCREELSRKAWITLDQDKGALCLSCADLDHLVFLSAGDAALTWRSRKYSTLSAVVLRWNRARKRYERQGLLVEEEALAQAEEECLADTDVRERRRLRNAERRAELDRDYVERFAAGIRELFPGCPPGRETTIAEHACLKYSGRIGRSAAAKELDETALHLAVIAHIRHRETNYDSLLATGHDRWEARTAVEPTVAQVLNRWKIGRAHV